MWRYLDQVRAQYDHHEQIEDRSSPKPEHNERESAQRSDRRTDDVRPLRDEAELIEHDARQHGFAYCAVDAQEHCRCGGGRRQVTLRKIAELTSACENRLLGSSSFDKA